MANTTPSVIGGLQRSLEALNEMIGGPTVVAATFAAVFAPEWVLSAAFAGAAVEVASSVMACKKAEKPVRVPIVVERPDAVAVEDEVVAAPLPPQEKPKAFVVEHAVSKAPHVEPAARAFRVPIQEEEPEIVVPLIAVAPLQCDLGLCKVGSSAATTAQFTITNIGKAPLHLGQLVLTRGNTFSFVHDPSGTVLPPGKAVDVVVSARPMMHVAPTWTRIEIPSDAANDRDYRRPEIVVRGGAPRIEVDCTQRDFHALKVGTTSAPQSVTITNSGDATLVLGQLLLDDGPFAFVNDPSGQTIAPAGTLRFNIVCTPSLAGPAKGILTVPSDGVNALSKFPTVELLCKGTEPRILVDCPMHDFGELRKGRSNAPHVVTITNGGDAPLVLGMLDVAGGDGAFTFAVDPSGATIEPQNKLTFEILCNPSRAGKDTGIITIPSDGANAQSSAPTVSLSCFGTEPLILVEYLTHDFGELRKDEGKKWCHLTITNIGDAPLQLGKLFLANDVEFSLEIDPSQATIGPRSIERFSVRCEPHEEGTRPCMLTIPSDAANEPSWSIPFTCIGSAPHLALPLEVWDFGDWMVGDVAQDGRDKKIFTIKSCGLAPLTITTIELSVCTDFTISPMNLPVTLAPEKELTFEVTFLTTLAQGPKRNAKVRICSDDEDRPEAFVTLTATCFRTYTIHGTALAGATPIVGATIELLLDDVVIEVADTTDQGYVFAGLCEGKVYWLSCIMPGYSAKERKPLGPPSPLNQDQTRNFEMTVIPPARHRVRGVVEETVAARPRELLDAWCSNYPAAPTGMRRYGFLSRDTEYIFQGSGVYFHVHRGANGWPVNGQGHVKPARYRLVNGTIVTNASDVVAQADFHLYGIPQQELGAAHGHQND